MYVCTYHKTARSYMEPVDKSQVRARLLRGLPLPGPLGLLLRQPPLCGADGATSLQVEVLGFN